MSANEFMNEKTISSRNVFDGRLLKIDVLDVELDSGVQTVREIVRHPGTAVILGELADGRFILVRQFRKAVERELLEAVAGTLEKGENPSDCAMREFEEETGYRIDKLRSLGPVCLAPGYSAEVLHMFHAFLDSEQGEANPDDDEKLDVVHVSKDQLKEMIASGEIIDAKTLAIWTLYQMMEK